MNYKKLYDRIISNAQSLKQDRLIEGYTENHHIIPDSLGGSRKSTNMVRLTAREHFICHYLLTKIYKKESFEWYKMINAFMMMKASSCYNSTRYFNSRLYESKRVDFSNMMKIQQNGVKNSQFGSIWIYNLELKISKKIKKEELPKWKQDGWLKGRKIKFDKVIVVCENCEKSFEQATKERFCSDSCRKAESNKINNAKEQLFIELYDEHRNTSKVLKMMGYQKNAGGINRWSKKILEKYKSRYTSIG